MSSQKLFEEPEKWQEHWEGMPEFFQKKQKPYAQIVFRFENEDDLQSFSKLIGQKLTKKTKSAWHPFRSHWGTSEKKIWEDES